MSLFKYFQRKEEFLPTPEQAGLSEKATKAANTAVMEVKSKKRKRYIITSLMRRGLRWVSLQLKTEIMLPFRAQFPDLGESTVRLQKQIFLAFLL